jgi:XRE family transcriptional regulator, regulator of sulfur utilization
VEAELAVGPAVQLGRSLRAHRDAARLSLAALAARSGVSKASLSMIEKGGANPSLETLWRLAGALGVSLGTLVGESEPPRTRLIRAGQGTPLVSDSGLSGRLLVTEGRPHRTEVIEFDLQPGAEYESRPHHVGTEEFVFCIRGRIEVGPQDAEERLRAGDALWFPADLPHRYRTSDGARCLLALSYPT